MSWKHLADALLEPATPHSAHGMCGTLTGVPDVGFHTDARLAFAEPRGIKGRSVDCLLGTCLICLVILMTLPGMASFTSLYWHHHVPCDWD